MGFVGRNDTRLTIHSRFAKSDENDFFLHYLLQKVFAINIFNFDQTSGEEGIWDFLLYLFPYFLKKALAQGIYKEYRRHEYNDANVKGTIDVSRHIRLNVPFQGNVAYTVREHSYDNPVMQLIRHTIEHIRCHPFGRGILTSDSDTRANVSTVCNITQATYNKNRRQMVISQNLRPVTHPYFSQYAALQKICLRILRHDKITFGDSKDKVYGLLFDGAWLWEEYLNTILKESFIHPENKTRKFGSYLFTDEGRPFQKIYPDFRSKSTAPVVVGDAKYIPLDNNDQYPENSARATSIYYKTIMYMYRFRSDRGMLLFPYSKSESEIYNKVYQIKDTNGRLWKLGLPIPQNAVSFNEFRMKMTNNETVLKGNIKSISTQ